MSNYTPKPGYGSVLKNRYRKEGSRQPEYTGYLRLDEDVKAGQTIKFGGWNRATKIGPVISIKISRKPDQEDQPDPEAGDVPF